MADAVDFDLISDGCTEGDGIFDQMMRSIKSHLLEEYNAQRIRGSEYSQVYLGAMQSAMQQSIQWQLSAQTSANQAELIAEQTKQVTKQTELTEEQIAQVVAQTELTKEQTNTQKEQTELVDQQGINAGLEADNIPKQGDNIDANTDLTKTQDENVRAQTLLVQEQTVNAEKEGLILDETKTKTKNEADTIGQKYKTEQAQINDDVDGSPVAGVIGKQKSLYSAQTEGFTRDAEQKATKITMDAWSVMRTTNDETELPCTLNSDGGNGINKAVDVLLRGIGADEADPPCSQ